MSLRHFDGSFAGKTMLHIISMTREKKIHWNFINFFRSCSYSSFAVFNAKICFGRCYFSIQYHHWLCFVVVFHLIFFDDDASSNTFFFSFEKQNNIEKLWNDKLFSSLISLGNRISVFVCRCLHEKQQKIRTTRKSKKEAKQKLKRKEKNALSSQTQITRVVHCIWTIYTVKQYKKKWLYWKWTEPSYWQLC